MTTEERLIQRVARSLVWARTESWNRDTALRDARRVVGDLLAGSAEGKATERAMRVIGREEAAS